MSVRSTIPVRTVDGRSTTDPESVVVIQNCPENSDRALVSVGGRVYEVYLASLVKAVRNVQICSEPT
jgi:hypothetical protein